MERTSPTLSGAVRRPLFAVGLLAAVGGVVGWLTPGGVGEPDPVQVTEGPSAEAYRSLGDALDGAPSWCATLSELASEGTLVLLGALLAWVCWRAVRRGDARQVAGALLGGVGTVAAYAASEALKLAVDEERPCRALRGAAVLGECPEPGDWSFPSNHATLAAGIAVGLAVLRPRLAAVTLPLAVAAALLRVVLGVHYPHDVLAGAVLGGGVTAAVLVALGPLAARAVTPLVARVSPAAGVRGAFGRGDHARLVGDDRRGGPVLHAEPGQNGADVRLDRALHHVQPPGDLPVGQPGAQEGEHLPLPGGERLDPRAGGRPPACRVPGAAGREVRDHPGGDLR